MALLVAAALVWLLFPDPPRASFSPAGLEFGTVRVGEASSEQLIEVTNVGERKLAVTALVFSNGVEEDYEVLENGCREGKVPSGGTCEVRLAFSPKNAGDRSTALVFEGNDRTNPGVALGARAVAPQLGLAPKALSFGVVSLEAEPQAQKVTLSNVGTAGMKLARIRIEGPAADDFSRSSRCPSSSLDPGEACSFEIVFAPSISGPRRAELVIEGDDPQGPGRLPIEGVGLWQGPPLDPDSDTVAFVEQRVGKRAAGKRVVFFNRTGAPVSIDSTAVSGSSSFAILEDGCRDVQVASAESCSMSVSFLPVRDGAEQAVLRLSAAGASENVEVGLRGKGVTPKMEAATREVDFGAQRLGFESAPQPVTLRNTGSATLTPRTASISGANGAEFLLGGNPCVGKPLAPGKSCTLSIGFNPSESGTRRAMLSVDPGFELEAIRVPVTGSGVVSALRADPGRLDYRNVTRGRIETRSLTLRNSGSARLELRGLRFEGDEASAFDLGKRSCPLDSGLAPGASCTLEIVFEPTEVGSHRAQLVLEYNGPDSPAKVELAGQGQDPAPVFRISAESLDLGSARIGGRGAIGTVTISNPGSAWLPLSSISLRGDHAESFQLVAGSCDGANALAPSGSCTVGVRVAPIVEGALRAGLLVRHGAKPGAFTVVLEGRGLPPSQ